MRKRTGMVTLSHLIVVLGLAAGMAAAQQSIVVSRVVLEYGSTPELREQIGAALSAVMQEMNRFAAGRGNDDGLRIHCTEAGFTALKQTIETTRCFSTIPECRANLVETPNNRYEVRGLKVRVDMGGTKGDPIQFLVFELNALGKIANVNFAIEEQYYNRLMQQGREQKDLFNRQIILDLMETFRTAHNRKDIDYLEKIYSDDALIIVGQVLQKKAEAKR